jgi:hypothetical protein
MLRASGKKATVEGVHDKRVLSDDTRTIELHHIQGNMHNDGLLMAYLPKEKLLVEADVYTPPPPNTPPPAQPNPVHVNLRDNIERLKLAVDQLLPLHGRIVPLSDLLKAIGKALVNRFPLSVWITRFNVSCRFVWGGGQTASLAVDM